MKLTKFRLTAAVLLFICLLMPASSFPASAAAAGAVLSGPGTVRAGDAITLTFKLNGSDLFGASGVLKYNADQLTLTDTKQLIASPWAVEFNGNTMLAYDNHLSSPISGGANLFSLNFKVKSLSTGSDITVTFIDLKSSDGSADTPIGNAVYSVKVAPPLSSNANLASLTVSNTAISPKFSPGTTNYTANVPFEISSLKVSAKAEDAKAAVTVNSPALKADGNTNVTVTVKAENGAKKVYTIKVYRPRDPNYVPSGDNSLKEINIEGFQISPPFSEKVNSYVVWLPFETETADISALTADAGASVEVIGGDKLTVGDNVVIIICTAENGEVKEYSVNLHRAAADENSKTDDLNSKSSSSVKTENKSDSKSDSGNIPLWLLLLLCILCSIFGGFVVWFLMQAKNKRDEENPDEEQIED